MVQYVADVLGEYKTVEKPVKRNGLGHSPGQSDDGYGKKITTDRCIVFSDSKRLYRVYAACFSNAASHYIVYKGQNFYLRD